MLEIAVADRWAMLDRLVDQRLREAGLVGFVVAPAAEAVHVDEDIALERGAEIHRELDDAGDRLRIFAVHMEDRHWQHLRDGAGVRAGAAFVRAGGETDLVVEDHVERAAGDVGRAVR